jgi:hypothetical protein
MTPATFTFVPMSVVAVNPQPLPPTALMQFNPLPGLNGLLSSTGTIQIPVDLHGAFQQSIASPSATGTPPVAPGHLLVIYDLQGAVSEAVTPATSATQPATLAGTFHLTGTLTEIFSPPGQLTQPPWVIRTTFGEQGSFSGPLNVPTTAGMPAIDPIAFTSQVTLGQTETRIATAAAGSTPWSVQSTLAAAGTFMEQAGPPVTPTVLPAATPFTVADQITEHLTPVTTTTPPPAPITIAAMFDAAGTVSTFSFPPNPIVLPGSGAGFTQYTEHLTETITTPPSPTNPGSTQTVMFMYSTAGTFQSFLIAPPIVTPGASSPGDIQLGSSSGPTMPSGPASTSN